LQIATHNVEYVDTRMFQHSVRIHFGDHLQNPFLNSPRSH
jgi:hypothetical protein